MAFGDFTVTRASTKNVLGSAGLYVSVANNVPAFEFNTDGTYRGLLVEPGATNQIRNNSMVGAVAGTPGTLPTNWGESIAGLTREVIGTGAENGVTYIDIKLSGTATSTAIAFASETSTSIVASSGQVWTNSHFLKIVSAPTPPVSFALGIREGTAAGAQTAAGNAVVVPTTTLTRFSYTRTLTAGTTERVQPQLLATVVNGNTYDFTIRIGWPQMETGSVATSPIVTTGSTAARVADVISLTSASSLIGQTEGTMYAEVDLRAYAGTLNRRIFDIYTDASNRISVGAETGVTIAGVVVNGGAIQAQITSSVFTAGVKKIAFAYKANDFALYIDGVQIGTDVSGTVPTVSNVAIGTNASGGVNLGDRIRSVALFPTRLSNAQLASLTTP
jgi:hypothetical protein